MLRARERPQDDLRNLAMLSRTLFAKKSLLIRRISPAEVKSFEAATVNYFVLSSSEGVVLEFDSMMQLLRRGWTFDELFPLFYLACPA